MKNYMPALIASIITGILLLSFLNKQQTTDDLQTSKTIISQPEKPALSLQLGAEPLGSGVYVSGSLSTIQVNNGTQTDVLVKLINTDNGQSVMIRNFYIPRGSIYKAEQLPEGSYKVVYAYGIDWNTDKKRFNRKSSFSIADKLLDVRKTITEVDGANGKQINTNYGGHTIELKPTIDGNFPAHPINEKTFNET